MFIKVSQFKKFIGLEAWKYFWISALIGIFWFAVESSFIFVMQGFLFTVGLLTRKQTLLPSWYPVGLASSVIIMIIFGVFRASIYMLKTHFASLTQLTFTSRQRINLLSYGLKNAHLISSKELVSIFTEITSQSGVVIYNSSMLMNTMLSAFLFFVTGVRLAPCEMLTGVFLLALFLFPLKYITRRINDYGLGLIQEWENLSESLLRGLKNNFFLSIYNQVDHEIYKGNRSLSNYKKHYLSYSLVAGFASAFPLLIGVAILSLITYLSVKYFNTEAIKLVSFFYIFIRLAQAASEANATIAGLKLNVPGLRILYDWNKKMELANAQISNKKMVITDECVEIELVNVSFGYDKQKFLLKNLNFRIGPSEMLLIKGESGVGKSTLLSLILGLRIPTNGEVRINSHSSKTVLFDLHRVLAYVGPEPYLIEGTIRENLTYGLDQDIQVSDEDLWNSLHLMGLKELVESLPAKLGEFVNDVPQLSTGQRQRLSFARAVVRKPTLLILDEATANLDQATEKKIINNLKTIFQNCTSIVVTHKNSFDDVTTYQLDLNAKSLE